MSSAPLRPISAHSDGDPAGTARALAVCLRGAPRSEVGAANEPFSAAVVSHLLRVRAAAAAGDVRAVLEADRARGDSGSSETAGRAWLATRAGSSGPPVLARLAAAAARGETPARFDTVLAVRAASFHIAVVPMLQAALFARWAATRPETSPDDALDSFLRDAAADLASIPALLACHDVPRPVAVAAGH